jgi:hypothetical protein
MPQPHVVVASSMGAAIALEAYSRGVICCPMLLLAPALPALMKYKSGAPEDSMKAWCDRFNLRDRKSIVVIHGELDTVIDISGSRDMCAAIGASILQVPGKCF